MARKLHILMIVFCLGVFIIPKQNVFAQIFQQSCCTTAGSGDCCPTEQKDTKPCHGKEKKSCGADCTNCKSCTTTTAFTSGSSSLKVPCDPMVATGNLMDFCYLSPEFSDPAAKIWQPPKIG